MRKEDLEASLWALRAAYKKAGGVGIVMVALLSVLGYGVIALHALRCGVG